MINNLSAYKQLIIENSKIVFGLVGSGLLLFFIFLPTATRLPTSYQKNKEQKEELKNVTQRLENINKLVSLQQSLKSSLTLVDKALPSAEGVPSLMIQIQAIATESGVTLKALQFGGLAKVEGAPYRKISLQAILEGTFTNLSTLLKTLENSSRLVDVESVAFDTRKGEGSLSAALGLSAYFLDTAVAVKTDGMALTFTSKVGLDTLDYLKKLKIYEPQTSLSTTGKSNPFE